MENPATVQYSENDERFIRYILKSDGKDLDFTEAGIKMALKESIAEEMDIAREHAKNQKRYQDKEELGLDYTNKNSRIKIYISDYERKWNEGKMIGYNEETRECDIEKVYNAVISDKISKNYKPYYKDMRTRIADVMAGKYIASLNDSEFLQLLQDEKLISPEQVQSLTRKYRDIEHLLDEAYIQSNWKTIASIQEKTTEEEKEGIEGEVK